MREIGVAGRVVTLDASHGCPNTARLIVNGGDHYVEPIKVNRQALLNDVRVLDRNGTTSHTTDKGRGRLEARDRAQATAQRLE